MKAFIVNPKSYFKEENIRLKFSLLILLAASLSQITDSIALSYYIITLSDAAGPLIVGSLIAAFGEMAAIIGLWFLYSSICHTMSLVGLQA